MKKYQISILELDEDGDPIDEPIFSVLQNLAAHINYWLSKYYGVQCKIDDSSSNTIDILIETDAFK